MPRLRSVLEKIAPVRDDEVVPVLLAALGFFLALGGYSMLRPIREAMGVEREMSELRALFVATMVVTVLANIVLGAVVSRAARRLLLPAVYRAVSLCLVVFVVVLWAFPGRIGSQTGAVFYVWLSVANLFLTSLFWVTMTDCLSLEQAKRLFPIVAVGGTLGALAGASINRSLVESIGVEWIIVLAIVMIECAVWTLGALRRSAGRRAWRGESADSDRPVGGRSWQGVTLVMRSPYLMGIVCYILLVAIGHTLVYFATREIVRDAADTRVARSALFANIDILTQTGTLVIQMFLAGRLMKWLGVGVSLAALPLVLVGGFAALAAAPVYAAAALFAASFRVGKYAVMRPARETLFTVVNDNERLAAKPLIDTFVYRFGDVIGAAMPAVMLAAVPVGVAWGGVGFWLGRKQTRLADTGEQNPAARAPS